MGIVLDETDFDDILYPSSVYINAERKLPVLWTALDAAVSAHERKDEAPKDETVVTAMAASARSTRWAARAGTFLIIVVATLLVAILLGNFNSISVEAWDLSVSATGGSHSAARAVCSGPSSWVRCCCGRGSTRGNLHQQRRCCSEARRRRHDRPADDSDARHRSRPVRHRCGLRHAGTALADRALPRLVLARLREALLAHASATTALSPDHEAVHRLQRALERAERTAFVLIPVFVRRAVFTAPKHEASDLDADATVFCEYRHGLDEAEREPGSRRSSHAPTSGSSCMSRQPRSSPSVHSCWRR